MAAKTKGPLLTAARARKLFRYNRRSGVLRWRVDIGNQIKAGDRAGTLAKRARSTKSERHRHCKAMIRQVQFEGRTYLEHRLIWLIEVGRWPRRQIDHRDNNSANNRWRNLRLATPRQNIRNTGVTKRNRSGLKWVRSLPNGTFQATLRLHLGTFRSAQVAHQRAARVARLVHGEFFNPGSRSAGPGPRL